MKPKTQKSQGNPNKKPTFSHAKATQWQKPNYKQKGKPKPKTDKPNKPEVRQMIRQQNAAKAEAERQQVRAEKEARIKAYKKQRLEKTKAISKRTQRGQPLMKDRMQLLLKQIEEMKQR
ncbi:thyroid transcription factor 1-associated protein 26 [Drosophila subobscura]|uniref:thyroid transcription factor 1-associated protein 26 n=1 Tax=Drosophila subobscura TaxID=7241 RepID=UPI00155AA5A7|nr:thyroid transcription factor 1-associated protein 26 [Drosophila subobscura]XP_034665544.1 thyroid transcription factor 1-associated protein 26 [Drosophila subobscura]XP_034665545.1 thyroid transcription factor 1-associated protein 26 [Drosophila subobscura]